MHGDGIGPTAFTKGSQQKDWEPLCCPPVKPCFRIVAQEEIGGSFAIHMGKSVIPWS